MVQSSYINSQYFFIYTHNLFLLLRAYFFLTFPNLDDRTLYFEKQLGSMQNRSQLLGIWELKEESVIAFVHVIGRSKCLLLVGTVPSPLR